MSSPTQNPTVTTPPLPAPGAAAAPAGSDATSVPTSPTAGAPGKKILVVLSSSDHVTLEGGRTEPTGFFMNELCTPLAKLLENGYTVEFANPKGTMPASDPTSMSLLWYLGSSAARDKHKDLIERMKHEANFSSPRRFADISDAELEGFAGLFIPGGHAPLEDLAHDEDLGRIIMHFHRTGKTIGAICHGPVALISTMKDPRHEKFAFETYKMTAYSNKEEVLNEIKWMHKVKIHVESELAKHGALFSSSILPLGVHVVEDRELVTGQNPSSASSFADAFLKKLAAPWSQRRRSSVGKVVAVAATAPPAAA
ncbi:class I glutamine amidotransferase-like protein [Hyaloraphidium curvatum]|nr:class I glutamine amidotransferase-like protein [Hyaloraphidium curvatum]